ncbi:hypothetical protein Trydic_g2276, partial [Trypoxylus dichotomus]
SRKRHNSLLHINDNVERPGQGTSCNSKSESSNAASINERPSSISTHIAIIKPDCHVLLPTALFYIKDYSGEYHQIRVLLDSGSQSNFISNELSKRLKLPSQKIRLPVRGINQSSTEITGGVRTKIKAIQYNYEVELFCSVVPQITDNLPNFSIDGTLMNIPANLTLADPSLYIPSKVDMLLGPGIFSDLLCVGQIRIGPGQPILQKSKLGWILSGPVNASRYRPESIENGIVVNLNVHEQIERVLDESTVKDELSEYYITDANSAKVLGILRNANGDLLAYRINEINVHTKRLTKRITLSHIAQIFDPLCLLAPVTIRANIMAQRLWQLKLEWGEFEPFDIYTACARFFRNISLINELKIKRHCVIEDAVDIQLHCFCDASIEAYGACLYVVCTKKNGGSESGLLCAKSRVAPLKSVTLPCLELCGALLLA